MVAPTPNPDPEAVTKVLKGILGRWLRGPLGPFLISACVVLGFGFRDWLLEPKRIRPNEGATLACELASIVDGDTLDVVCGEGHMRVRLWGIDAPEMPQIPWGDRARRALTQLASSGNLSVEVIDHDKYGRVVGRVFSTSQDIGLELARQGLAPVPLKYVRDIHYRQAQRAARSERRGVWGIPGAQQRPWEWRKFNPRPGKGP